MNTIKQISIIFLFLFAIQFPTFSQANKVSNLEKQMSLIDNRVLMNFPIDAKNTSVGVYKYDLDTTVKTRIETSIQGVRVIFYAEELFKSSNDNFVETFTKENSENKFKSKTLKESKVLTSVLGTPTIYDTIFGTILINQLYIKTSDNLIIKIGVHIEPKGMNMKEEVEKFSEKVLLTLVNGKRTITRNAHKEIRESYGSEKKFEFNLPENYVITEEQDYYGSKLTIRKITDYLDTNMIDFTFNYRQIQALHNNSFDYDNYLLNFSDAIIVKNKFLGKSYDWLTFEMKEYKLFLKEQILVSNKIRTDINVHISMLSNNILLIDEMTSIIESIGLK